MKASVILCPAAALILAGCEAPRVGAPERAGPPGGPATLRAETPAPLSLPDRIELPAAYRLMLLDGHLTLVRESDASSLAPAPTSLRVVAGELSRGELAYQPGLLPQELAAEVAANRESTARMENALEGVMRRSRELSEQALELKAQSGRLAALLASEQARIAPQDAPSGKASPKDPPPREP